MVPIKSNFSWPPLRTLRFKVFEPTPARSKPSPQRGAKKTRKVRKGTSLSRPGHNAIDFSYLLHKLMFLKVFVIGEKRIMRWTLTIAGRYCAPRWLTDCAFVHHGTWLGEKEGRLDELYLPLEGFNFGSHFRNLRLFQSGLGSGGACAGLNQPHRFFGKTIGGSTQSNGGAESRRAAQLRLQRQPQRFFPQPRRLLLLRRPVLPACWGRPL